MPNYVKVVPSIAIAFVSYEQVNVLSLGLHCKCMGNAASASDGLSCHNKCICALFSILPAEV